MRGTGHEQREMFSYVSAERRVPKDPPLRPLRVMVNVALKALGRASPALGYNWGVVAPEFPRQHKLDGTA